MESYDNRQSLRKNLEVSASLLRDMLIGKANHNNNNNNSNMDEVKLRHKPRRQASSADRLQHRHSMHDPYQYYFNPLDGFIYNVVPWQQQEDDFKGKDSVRRKAESRRRNEQNRSNTCSRAAFPHAPYYVSDTLSNDRCSSLSSPQYSDQAEAADTSLDTSFQSTRSVNNNNNNNKNQVFVLDRGCQASHRFDIRDYAVLLEEETTPSSSSFKQHTCCQCECHNAAEEEGNNMAGCSSSSGGEEENESCSAAAAAAALPRPCSPAHVIGDHHHHRQTDSQRVNHSAAAAKQRQLLEQEYHRGSLQPQQQQQTETKEENEVVEGVRRRRNMWGGVSGVPGLGVSIPQRPQSACCENLGSREWMAANDDVKNKPSNSRRKKREEDNSSSSGSNENESSSSWSPHSLQSLSHLKKLDLPRISACQQQQSANRGSLRGHPTRSGSVGSQNSERSASSASANMGAVARLQQLSKRPLSHHLSHSSVTMNKQQQQQQHPALAGTKSSNNAASRNPNPMTVAQVHWSDDPEAAVRQMPWQDSVIKRSLQRQSYQWGNEDTRDVAAKKSSFDKRFPHLAAILKSESGGPHSLPLLRFDSSAATAAVASGGIPRAPIPVPPQASNAKRESEDRDISHYETLREQESSNSRPEFSRRSLIHHVQSNSGGGGDDFSSLDDTFDSIEIPMAKNKISSSNRNKSNSQLYKVLHDRDGDYAYAYDCSLSPAFLIRYNDEHPVSSSEESENIYEEITEVKKRVVKEDECSAGSSSSSSAKSSNNADSGVHLSYNNNNNNSSKRYSNDTLDFGPKKSSGMRQLSRFSNGSADSFAVSSETSAAEEDNGNKFRNSVAVVPVKTVSNEEFCEIIRRHHTRVLEQLRLDPDDFGPNRKEEAATEQEVNKAKARKFGFASRRGKSAGALTNNNSQTEQQQQKMKRCESLDMSLEEANKLNKQQQQQQHQSDGGQQQQQSKGGWLRKYSKKYLSRLPSMSGGLGGGGEKAAAAEKQESNVSSALDNSGNESFSVDGEGDQQMLQRFQRSRITSRWENLHSLPE